MKIYFYDGSLHERVFAFGDTPMIDAGFGHTKSVDKAKLYQKDGISYITNYVVLLNFAQWNFEETTGRWDCNVYLWNKKEKRFQNIQNFTNRELRAGHNLEKLYCSGEFEVEE